MKPNCRQGSADTYGSYRIPLDEAGRVARAGGAIMKRYKAFTLIELLTVVSIITLLIAILIPALNRARRQAKDVNCGAFVHAIETALEMFQNERGEYPPSDPLNPDRIIYTDRVAEDARIAQDGSHDPWFVCGAHMLAETLVGTDRMGFDPTGRYDPNQMGKRVGPFLKVGQSGAVNDRDLENTKLTLPPWKAPKQPPSVVPPLPEHLAGSMILLDPSWGTPVLYYRANPRGQTTLSQPTNGKVGCYVFDDNSWIGGDLSASEPKKSGWRFGGERHQIDDPTSPAPDTNQYAFERYITDPKAGTPTIPIGRRPYNPDTYLLITAGYDKVYGTQDDIVNWTKPK